MPGRFIHACTAHDTHNLAHGQHVSNTDNCGELHVPRDSTFQRLLYTSTAGEAKPRPCIQVRTTVSAVAGASCSTGLGPDAAAMQHNYHVEPEGQSYGEGIVWLCSAVAKFAHQASIAHALHALHAGAAACRLLLLHTHVVFSWC